jgi:hypothetical protein
MKIALIGATGYIGSVILQEALSRGHQVTGIARQPEKMPGHPNLIPSMCDIRAELKTATLLLDHEAVISAYAPDRGTPDVYEQVVSGYRAIIRALKKVGIRRLLVTGGAGSLEISPGVQLVDTLDLPEQWKPGILGIREVLHILRKEAELDWTFLSPSQTIAPGKRTGQFRIGGDGLLTGADGKSRISLEDYAMAMIDELENPKHIRQRFTVGY